MDKDKDENIDILEDNSELSNETNDCSDSESKRPSLWTSFKCPFSKENESYAYVI